jgi:hypothetical protein
MGPGEDSRGGKSEKRKVKLEKGGGSNDGGAVPEPPGARDGRASGGGGCPRFGLFPVPFWKTPSTGIKIQMYTYEKYTEFIHEYSNFVSKMKSQSHYCTKVGLSWKMNIGS